MRIVQITIACTKGEREREREVGHTSINITDNGKEIFQCYSEHVYMIKSEPFKYQQREKRRKKERKK